jgi:hypothetical protein
MGLMDTARNDLNHFLNNSDDFAQDIILIDTGGTEYPVKGYHTDHTNQYDEYGVRLNTKLISIAIPELTLIEINYPYKTPAPKSEVDFKKHKAKITDAAGDEKEYMVAQWYPDRELGIIVVQLQYYTS